MRHLLPAVVAAAVDLSPEADLSIADQIVDVAAAWAESMGARLVILTAASAAPVGITAAVNLVVPGGLSEAQRAHVVFAEAHLLQLVDRARALGLDVTASLITSPGPLPELLASTAAEHHAGLLVLASRGKRGLMHALLGSVAEKTAHLSTVPVLLLPPA
jgi:nucleotide-binding universal stress UspA family protein